MRTLRMVTIGVGLAAIVPTSASAADSIFWTNEKAPTAKIAWAALDASIGGDLATPGVAAELPAGVAVDAAAGRAYWADTGLGKGQGRIAWANLDGSGGGTLVTTGADVANPIGIALDPVAGRVYWANAENNRISFANTNNTGGGNVTTTGATADYPQGVAVDPAAGRIYWANKTAGKLSFARLDGTGGADINVSGTTVKNPFGVAVDPVAGRIYWANTVPAQISFANLDGTGGGNLTTTGATVAEPHGVAIDPIAGRVYWANYGAGKISYARLDGSGGADVATLTATVKGPQFPALLKRPQGIGAPAITGAAGVGSTLTCSDATWAPDLPSAFLSRAPQTVSYAWTRDAAPVAGATAKTVNAAQAGAYRCTVTATNRAGSTEQASAPVAVGGAATPPPASNPGTGTRPSTPGTRASLTVVGTVGRKLYVRTRPGGRVIVTGPRKQLKTSSRRGGPGTFFVRLTVTARVKNQLRDRTPVAIPLTVRFVPTSGAPITKSVPVVLRRL